MSSISSSPCRAVRDESSRRLTLSGVVRATERSGGIGIIELEPLTVLLIRTANTVYRVTVLKPYAREALVQGGSFFAEPTTVTFSGSSAGGRALKLGWIGLGLHLEFQAGGQRIVTSRVRTFEVEQVPSGRPS